jgi:predicted transcriptional regulator
MPVCTQKKCRKLQDGILHSLEKFMKRDQMLLEAILAYLLKSPEAEVGPNSIGHGLNMEMQVIRHHLYLLQDKGFVQLLNGNQWRLTNLGHDYLEGTPGQGISLQSLGS